MEIECPRCNQLCEGEAPHKPWWYQFECECGREFCYDGYTNVYYDIDGNEIREGDRKK